MVVGLDADTVMPPNAVADWQAEMETSPGLGGSSSKFTMPGSDWLTRLQRSEFSRWSQTSIKRGYTSVLAGTGCAMRGEAMRAVAALPDREGPWCYSSAVEDFELTYQLRRAGWRCQVSPTVPAYTDSMKTIHALWNQRMKWSVGTVSDLLTFGINKLTYRDWLQQALGLLSAVARILWISIWIGGAITGELHPNWT
jgi:poly-beta-1,6-N-acetyl-D-glucosamine synthase